MTTAQVIDADYTVLEPVAEPTYPCKWCKQPAPDRKYWASVLGQPVPFCRDCATRITFLANAIPMAVNQIGKTLARKKSEKNK